jgi:hypothetical protein
MTILEFNTGSSNTLPGPVKMITLQAGQIVVVDKTTEPPTTTTLNPDDVYDAEGKAGLTILDIDGSRIFYESTLENRTSGQMVDTPGSAVQRGDTDSDSPTGGTGAYEDRTVAELKATAEKNGVDLDGASRKDDIIAKLRGE